MSVNSLPANNKRQWGDYGERYASEFLKEKGYKIIEKNFRSKLGEIDLIAIDPDGVLIFVEVKTRWSRKFGKPEEAVNKWKLEKIKKTAQYYIMTHNNLPSKQRIDVVAIEASKSAVRSAKIIKVY